MRTHVEDGARNLSVVMHRCPPRQTLIHVERENPRARRPLPGAVRVEGIADDLRPKAEPVREIQSTPDPAESALDERCSMVVMRELPCHGRCTWSIFNTLPAISTASIL